MAKRTGSSHHELSYLVCIVCRIHLAAMAVIGESMKTWEERVQELETEGCTRSDAQGVADAEASKGLIQDSGIGKRSRMI